MTRTNSRRVTLFVDLTTTTHWPANNGELWKRMRAALLAAILSGQKTKTGTVTSLRIRALEIHRSPLQHAIESLQGLHATRAGFNFPYKIVDTSYASSTCLIRPKHNKRRVKRNGVLRGTDAVRTSQAAPGCGPIYEGNGLLTIDLCHPGEWPSQVEPQHRIRTVIDTQLGNGDRFAKEQGEVITRLQFLVLSRHRFAAEAALRGLRDFLADEKIPFPFEIGEFVVKEEQLMAERHRRAQELGQAGGGLLLDGERPMGQGEDGVFAHAHGFCPIDAAVRNSSGIVDPTVPWTDLE